MPKTLQSEIKRLRSELQLRQQDVADKLKLKRSSYALKELEGSFTDNELKQLAKILKTNYESLVTHDIGHTGLVKNSQEYLLQYSIRMESMNRQIIKMLAVVIAKTENRKYEEVIREAEESINAESLQILKLLK